MPLEIVYCDKCGRLIPPGETGRALVVSGMAVCESCAESLSPAERDLLSKRMGAADRPGRGPRARRERRTGGQPAASGASSRVPPCLRRMLPLALGAVGMLFGIAFGLLVLSGDDAPPGPLPSRPAAEPPANEDGAPRPVEPAGDAPARRATTGALGPGHLFGPDGAVPRGPASETGGRSRGQAGAGGDPLPGGAPYVWDGSSDGDGDGISWGDPLNWRPDRGFPNGPGVRVVLNALESTKGVRLNRPITVGEIRNTQRNNRNNIFHAGGGGRFIFDNGDRPALIYQRRGDGAQLRMMIHVDMVLKSDLVYDFWSQRYAAIDCDISGPGKLTLKFAGDSPDDVCEIKGGKGRNTYSGGTELRSLKGKTGRFKASKQGAFGTGDLTVRSGVRLTITDGGAGGEDRIPDAATVRLLALGTRRGVIRLDPGVREEVGALCLDGVPQEPGTWGSSGSAAENRTDDWFAGTGVLVVSRR